MTTHRTTHRAIDARVTDCPLCIDEWAPGFHPCYGPHYTTCPACRPACPACRGVAMFPAANLTLPEIIERANRAGWLPIFCLSCAGVLRLYRLRP